MNTLATLITLISLSIPLCTSANTAQVFYQGTENLSGYELKTALMKKLRSTHKDKGYSALINVYFQSDVDTTYDNDGSLVDIYSENPRSYDSYKYTNRKQVCGNYKGEAGCFNREHIVPQSSFRKASPMRSDFFHVYPTDGYVNNRRSNHPFGEVTQPRWVSKNGSKLGMNTFGKYRGIVFEPIDEFKGDIARALLYFATRYETRVGSFNNPMFDGSNDQVYADWFLKMLLKWHKQDPVCEHEIHRNEIGYKFQGNRNPFIDHPEYVEKIWLLK